MSFLVGFLTFLLVMVCLALVLLVLLQIPKKDAGAGFAFGGGAVDALFGAGAGNALTKITKWAIVVFVVLTVLLGALEVKLSNGNASEFEQGVESQQQNKEMPQVTAPPISTPSQSQQQPSALPLLSATNTPMVSGTNAPLVPATTTPAATPPAMPLTTTNGN